MTIKILDLSTLSHIQTPLPTLTYGMVPQCMQKQYLGYYEHFKTKIVGTFKHPQYCFSIPQFLTIPPIIRFYMEPLMIYGNYLKIFSSFKADIVA